LSVTAPEETLRPAAFQISTEADERASQLTGAAVAPIVLAPGVGQDPQRAWPIAHFLRLAGELTALGHHVTWIEGPQDASLFAALPEKQPPTRIKLDAGRPNVLAALLKRARLLVCNDTFYVHLAAALDTPTVAIFGAGQKGRFLPQFGQVHVIQGDPVCRGCQWQCAFSTHICVQDVPYAPVRSAVEKQLAAPHAIRERLAIALPASATGDANHDLEWVRDWYQQELYRLRWDGWARLQVIKDANEQIRVRDEQLAQLRSTASHLSHRAANPSARLPKISVVIPMGRPERVDGTLRSLERQSLRPEHWEIIVVGVGASTLVPKYPNLPLVPVDLVRNLLPPRTRVEGVAKASGEWILFVDDDVQLAPDFFEMLARVLALPSAQAELRVGAIGVRMPGGRGTYFEHLTDISNFWSQQSSLRAVPHGIWFLYSAAIVVRAEAYRQSGGFNPELPNGEDVDLTQRITASGYVLAYEPSLVAYHHHGRDSLFRMWHYFWRNGNAAQHFFSYFGGTCCYSLRTALVRAWRDLQMNRNFQRTQGVRLGAQLPWILVNYVIFENSLEWHYQKYLWASKQFRELPARTASDRNAVKAFEAWDDGRTLVGLAHYAIALVQNLIDPVRR
jgi:glycosyltransferase involved in cell wall biosynthesis